MKKPDTTLSICVASSIICLAVKLSGVWDAPWLLVLLPVIFYGFLCMGACIVGMLIGFIFSIPEYRCSKRPNFQNTPPMYWDPVSKQFYLHGEPLINEDFDHIEETGRYI